MGAALHLGGLPHGHSHGSGSSHSHKHHSHDGKKSKKNINVRAAFIHVLGDFFQSIGVLVAAVIIYFKPEWQFIDPICTFVFSIIVLFTTFNIIKDTLNVIMEGTSYLLLFIYLFIIVICFCNINGYFNFLSFFL